MVDDTNINVVRFRICGTVQPRISCEALENTSRRKEMDHGNIHSSNSPDRVDGRLRVA
jgi:hypothetical protein